MQNPVAGRLVRFGEFHLDLQSGELERDGNRVLLPEQPFRLLAILIRERGALVSRDSLRRQLWPEGTFVDFEPSLNAAVKRVREALGDSADAPRYIETLPRRGYRFIAPVEDVTPRPIEGPNDAPADAELRIDRPAPAANAPETGPLGTASPIGRVMVGPRGWIAVGVALGLLTGSALLLWGPTPTPTPASSGGPPAIERLTDEGTVRLGAVSPDGRDLAYVRREAVRESLWLKRHGVSSATRLLGPVDGTFRSLTFAGADTLHYMLFRPDQTPVRPFRVSTRGGQPEPLLEPAGSVSFSRDGSLCAYVASFSLTLRESRIVVSDANGNGARVISVRRPPHSFITTKPAWSPDGSRLAVFGLNETSSPVPQLIVIDVPTGRVLQESPLDLVVVDDAVWLPDGQHVVVSGRQRSATPQRLWLFSVQSATLRPLTSDLSDYALVGLSAGGRVLAVRSDVGRTLSTVRLRGSAAPDQIAQNTGDLGELEGLAWLTSDEILYTAAENGNVDIWAVSISRRTRRQLTRDAADDFHPSASADGRRIVFASNRGHAPGIWTMDRDGANQERLTTGADVRPSISGDGRTLVFQRGGRTVDNRPFTLWRLDAGQKAPAEIAEHHSMRPALSPDARSIAHYLMTAEAWMLAVTRTAGGPPARTLALSTTHAARVVRWSPDGRALAFIDGTGGASNIWLQPLDDGPALKLTNFAEGRITTFDWSRDGSALAWTRMNEVRDVVAMDISTGKGSR